ncbi:MAG TPA: ATP-binding protein [Ktedonobacteraceae bacterium]|nr:ATP-binding protein [Ktedonobacteraceae bacterium]
MLRILERKIALQLLVFYGLFVIPLLLGGAELYFFQYGALQQSAEQADLGLAEAIAQNVELQAQGTAKGTIDPAQLNARLIAEQQQLTTAGEGRIWILDSNGDLIADTVGIPPHSNLLQRIPGLRAALQGKPGSVVAQDQQRDWLYSYVPITGTNWAVAVGRPTDVTFAAVISFQHSLIIALIMLLAGASIFWFVMHGWMVAPLGHLARAVAMMRPDQTVKVMDGKQLTREKRRQDEIGRLVNAFATMEEEIHTLFRKSDEQSFSRLQTLDAIMRSMEEGVLLETPAGQIVYANHSFMQFVGFSTRDRQPDSLQESDLTERMESLMEDLKAYRESLHSAASGEGPQVIEFQVRGYYNQLGQLVPSRRYLRMRLFQVYDMANQLIGRGKIYNDVTQQSEAEKVKKNLLAIVSHELRTPLTAIKGYATSLLETDVELDATTQRDFLQRIVEEEDRMAELVTSLLEMSQLEAGTLKLAPGYCRLDTLIQRAIEAAQCEQLCVTLSLPAEAPVLYVDQRRMEMVLRNILENAQRYAVGAGDPGGETEIEITARYALENEDQGVYLSIVDNGPGLPGDLTERIFERFYQVDGGRLRSSSGVGLGLSICRGFVEAHGGRIWAENRTGNENNHGNSGHESNDGSGAAFHIWLPSRLLYVPGSRRVPFELEKAL